jgi:hypothetical protein
MPKKWVLGCCAAGVIAVAAAGTGVASAATASSQQARWQPAFTVYTHMIEAHVVSPCSGCATPALPAGSRVGTWLVNDPAFDQQTGGRQIGQEALVISVVSSDASTALLTGALDFTADGLSGQLTVSGEINANDSSGEVAVTGGTGRFEGARGVIDYSGAGLSSMETTLVIHLTR